MNTDNTNLNPATNTQGTNVSIDTMIVNNNPAIKLLVFKGQMDETNLQVFSGIMDTIVSHEETETKYILLNFKELEFLNSKVIGYLASIYAQANELDKKIIIVEANPNIYDILSLVGLTTIIDNFATLVEAIDFIQNNN